MPNTCATPSRQSLENRSDQGEQPLSYQPSEGGSAGRGGVFGRDLTQRCFDPVRYAQRNTIDRGFGRLKQSRGIATRYDKYALTFLGAVLLVAALQYRL